MADTHTCKNCGAVENLKTGELTYKGDNPLLKENETLKDKVKKLEITNKNLAKLAAKKSAKPKEAIKPREEPNAEEKDKDW